MTHAELTRLSLLVAAKNSGQSVEKIARKWGVSPGMLRGFYGICSAVGVEVARKPLSEASKVKLRANAAKARAALKPAVPVLIPAQDLEDFRRWKSFIASMETRPSTAA